MLMNDGRIYTAFSYEQLRPREEQQAILEAVDRVQSDRDHPSLRTKNIQGRLVDIWEVPGVA